MPKKKTTKRKTAKAKLVGFTKVGSKYALVFKRGRGKPYMSSSRFSSKKTLTARAKRLLK